MSQIGKRESCVKPNCPNTAPPGFRFCGQCTREHRAANLCEACGINPLDPAYAARNKYCGKCVLVKTTWMNPVEYEPPIRRSSGHREDRYDTRSGG